MRKNISEILLALNALAKNISEILLALDALTAENEKLHNDLKLSRDDANNFLEDANRLAARSKREQP